MASAPHLIAGRPSLVTAAAGIRNYACLVHYAKVGICGKVGATQDIEKRRQDFIKAYGGPCLMLWSIAGDEINEKRLQRWLKLDRIGPIDQDQPNGWSELLFMTDRVVSFFHGGLDDPETRNECDPVAGHRAITRGYFERFNRDWANLSEAA